jgi:hypothetical protein
MSAWVVSRAHIDAIMSVAVQRKVCTAEEATAIGHMLWRENVRSVNFRYDERGRTPSYRFTEAEEWVDSAVALKLLHCLGYQSCERPDWQRSEAYAWLLALEEKLGEDPFISLEQVRSVHGATVPAYYNTREYSEAPWAIDRLEEVYA